MIRQILIVFLLIGIEQIYGESKVIDLLMPNITPKEKDSYLCYKLKLDEVNPVYITEFQPRSTKEIAHHMLVYGCEKPGSMDEVWNCGEMNSAAASAKKEFSSGPICKGEQSIIYGWAMDAPKLTLPSDVAFKLGAGTHKKYLVIQVHYATVDSFKNGKTDNSGVRLIGQSEPLPNIAGVYLLVTNGFIKSHSKENFESACEMKNEKEMIPFAYRTHAHKLGKLNSGYLISKNNKGVSNWQEIGRRSPQLPQMFYPVSNNVTIKKGDIVAARCSMENPQNHPVHIGSTGEDEMCNFYIMYYTKGELTLDSNVCYTNGPPNWYFNDFVNSEGNGLDLTKMPADINEIPKVQQEELLKMKPHNHMKVDNQEANMVHEEHKVMPAHHDHMQHVEEEDNDLINPNLAYYDLEEPAEVYKEEQEYIAKKKLYFYLKSLLFNKYN